VLALAKAAISNRAREFAIDMAVDQVTSHMKEA